MARNTQSLLKHLPAIYQRPEFTDLHDMLAVFETVLLSADGPEQGKPDPAGGLAQKIEKIPTLFDPALTPSRFLPWLSQWVALSRAEELSEENLRKLIGESVQLYSWRGTKSYMHKMLKYFLPEGVNVGESDILDQGLKCFKVGSSKLGLDSSLGGDQPFCFVIRINTDRIIEDPEEFSRFRGRSEAIIRSVVDLAKPAHTSYALQWQPTGRET